MKILQIVFVKLMSALVLLLGIVLIFALFTGEFSLIEQAKAEYLSWPPFLQKIAWAAAGVALTFIGGIGLMPVLRRRRRQVSFEGPHGEVFYDLDSVEKTIERVVGRMKEIKSIDAHVVPAEDHRRVEVSADVILNPTGGSARNAATLVSQQIENAAEQMLGEDGVVKVVLRVKKILVDMKSPMLLVSSAPGHEAQQEIHGVEEAEREANAERQAALAKAARDNAAAEAAAVERIPEIPLPAPSVEPAKVADEDLYAYLPEDEEEEEEEEEVPVADRGQAPPLAEDLEDKSVLNNDYGTANLPPLDALDEDEEDRRDQPRPL